MTNKSFPAKCTWSCVEWFTVGNLYMAEVFGGNIYITHEDMVSEFYEGYGWKAIDLNGQVSIIGMSGFEVCEYD